jgi:hypothetical protein
MLTTALKTYLTILIMLLPPACNGQILIASYSDSYNANQGGGGNSQVEQGGNGGELNDMDSGTDGEAKICTCADMLYEIKCDDIIANQKFTNFKNCACSLDFTDNPKCKDCAHDFCINGFYNQNFDNGFGCFQCYNSCPEKLECILDH